ncbi:MULTISPECIES: hypothetical protein [unclassified Ensifer]|jgi:hypothetical protein|nr:MULTISPECIES: hypothetical protein [unclassified Ensifer]
MNSITRSAVVAACFKDVATGVKGKDASGNNGHPIRAMAMSRI